MANIKDKIFSKKLVEENERLKKELSSLKKEHEELKSSRRNETTANSFCSYDFVDYFLSDDFEENFEKMLKNLPDYSKNNFKWLLLRSIAVSFMKRETLFSNYELDLQKKFKDFEREKTQDGLIDGFKFSGNYNLHGFMDLGLSEKDKIYLKNKDIIDAGAFTGDTSLPLSKITSKKVYAFEPFKESFSLMGKNISDNNISNIKAENMSLGNLNGQRTLFLANDNYQGISSKIHNKNSEELVVEERTVDSYVEEHNLDVGLITVDIEGAEQDLLNGAIETITKQKPLLFISIYHNVHDFFEIKPWIEDLDLGYKFKIVKEQPWTFIADTVLQCRPY